MTCLPLRAPRQPPTAGRQIASRPVLNRLTLFGGAVVDVAGEPVTGRAAQRHRIALLALLCSTRRPQRSRDQLVAHLWPDANAERGRKLLSDSIYRINQALGGDAITGTGDDIRLNRDQLASDVASFEAATDARDWRCAADLYAGPFLDGFFLPGAVELDQWIEIERAHYGRLAAKAIEALALGARENDRGTEEVELWQRLAALVPDDSRVAIELMRTLEKTGNRAGALRHARVHAALLRETLGVEPDRGVRELADRISKRSDPAVIASIPAASSRLRVAAETRAPALIAPPLGSAIAVLPFDSVSESGADASFADGISDELIHLLTQTPGLRIASRTSAFAFRDLELDVREVARRLRVDWVLEGSVRRAGTRLRIVARLTEARSGYQLWSESFDRTSDDVFAIQDEVAISIAHRLAISVAPPLGPPEARLGTTA